MPARSKAQQRAAAGFGHGDPAALDHRAGVGDILGAAVQRGLPFMRGNRIGDHRAEAAGVGGAGGAQQRAHSLSPTRNCAARSRRMCGGPSPGFSVSGAGAKRMIS